MNITIQSVAATIRESVQEAITKLSLYDSDDVAFKKNPAAWSKKKILCHLIDSAANNHQRFVRACYKVALEFPPYSQNDWVRIQHYQECEWKNLLALWTAYNLHLAHLIEQIPPESLAEPCNIGKAEPVSLDFIIKDYLRHLSHHLDQLI
jgi:hypothetical protein